MDIILEVIYISYEKSDYKFIMISLRMIKIEIEIIESPKDPWKLYPNIYYIFYFQETMKNRIEELLRFENYQDFFIWIKWENLKI
jgi:hypothetical protein